MHVTTPLLRSGHTLWSFSQPHSRRGHTASPLRERKRERDKIRQLMCCANICVLPVIPPESCLITFISALNIQHEIWSCPSSCCTCIPFCQTSSTFFRGWDEKLLLNMALSDAVGCTLKRGGIFGTDSRGVWLKHAVGVNVLCGSCLLCCCCLHAH